MNRINRSLCISVFFLSTFHFLVLGQSRYIWWETSIKSYAKSPVAIKNTYPIIDIKNQVFEDLLEKIPYRFTNKSQKHTINFPQENNSYKNFVIRKVAVMHPDLAAKYPDITSFVGTAVDDPSQTIRFTYCKEVGLRGSITKPGKHTTIIKPVDRSSLMLYNSKKEASLSLFDCQTEARILKKINTQKTSLQKKNANDGNLRRYRLALSVSGSYFQYFLDGTEVDDTERKNKVMAAMVTTINRVNEIFERDFSVTMQIIPENDSLLFTDFLTDPYYENFNSELQNTIDGDPAIGNSAYDVGHLFNREFVNAGNAGCIGCVCTDGFKGSAYSSHRNPDSDNFDLLVLHEFGHQFGGYHVQSSLSCRSGNNSEVEPGSGSSIMSYAGICPENVQDTTDDYFNYVDIRDVAIWTSINSNCAEVIATGNTAPVVDAGNDYTIPKSTPFVLEGTANDIDGNDTLTYCWEQNDPESTNSNSSPQSNWVQGPLFRSKLPTTSNKRYIPQLEDIINGNLTPTWEVLPSVDRTIQFELTVRDNIPFGGQTNTDGIVLTVDATSGPFMVTSQASTETWNEGDQVTVSWDVANTDQTPINETTIDILLSIDGGHTYPYIIQENTPNDGSETFASPAIASSTTARVMVKASNNIFFAINSTDFAVQISEFTITSSNTEASVCELDHAMYNFDYTTLLDFDEDVTFSTENLPAGLTATFSPPSITGSQISELPIILTITGIENISAGVYDFSIKGNTNSGTEKNLNFTLETFENVINPSTLTTPPDNEIGIAIDQTFEWSEDINAASYEIEIATDQNFLSITETAAITVNNYSPSNLGHNTRYYWRVKNNNLCGSSNFSTINSYVTQCLDPIDFEPITVEPYRIELNWIDDNSSSWDIEYGPSGFLQGEGIYLSTSSKPYQITGLSSRSDYDFYLRSTCSIGGVGIWIGPLSVSTEPDFCAGDHFYDSGGIDKDYDHNENITTVLESGNNGERVRVVFDSFDVGNSDDLLKIYDGPNDSYPPLHSGSGYTGSPNHFSSSDASGSLTFVFISNEAITSSGWDAQVFCEPKPNCSTLTNFVINSVYTTTANIQWDTDGNSSSWDIEYGSVGFEEGTGDIVNSTTVNYTMNNLISNTSYDMYILGNCTNGGVSNKIGPISFRTKADFCSGDHFYDTGGLDELYGSNENISTVISPDNTGERVRVTFNSFNLENNFDYMKVFNGPDSSYPPLHSGTGYTGASVPGPFIASDPSGSLTFTFTSDNSIEAPGWDAQVICEIQPNCNAPNNFTINTIGDTFISVSWNSENNTASWGLEFGPNGFTEGEGTTINSTGLTITIDQLNPITSYDLYIKENCTEGGVSDTADPLSFTTLCKAYIPPFTESFLNDNTPQCWEEQGTEDWSYGTYDDDDLGILIPDRTYGTETNYIWNTTTDTTVSYLTTPLIDVSSLQVPSIQFSLYSNDIVNDAYSTLNVAFFDGTTWNTLLTFGESTQGWRDYYFDISSYNITKHIKLRFSISGNADNAEFNYIFIDEIKVGELPTCLNPHSLSVAAITPNSISASWDIIGSQTSWELEYGAPGFTLGTGTTLASNVRTNALITNLQTDTTYDLYVRTICGSGDYSEYIGPVHFTTFCNPIMAPFIETFANISTPNCWTESGIEDWNYNTAAGFDAQNAGDHTPRETTAYAWIDGSAPYGEHVISNLSTPLIDISELMTPSLQFAVYSVNTNDDSYHLLSVAFFDGSNWNPVVTIQENTGGWQEHTIDLSAYTITGAVQAKFTITENSPGNPILNDILLDDIAFDEFIHCNNPVDIIISDILPTATTITIAPAGDESQWDIEYGLSGFVLGDGNAITANTTSFSLDGLESNTSYDIYARTNCTDAMNTVVSEFIGPYSFNTLPTLTTEDSSFSKEILIVPNPNNGNFMIIYNGASKLEKILIFDITGKLIKKEAMSQFEMQQQITIDNPESGMYFINIIVEDKETTKRLIIK